MTIHSYLFDNLVKGLGFDPTSCQLSLFDSLSSFISDSDFENRIMLVNGYAGTGKTSAISSLVQLLKQFDKNFILMAPTGRAAKVLSGYSGCRTYTIHKQIYRQKSLKDGIGHFTLDINKNKDTLFIVDEASLISSGINDSALFGSGNLLDDLVSYVRMNSGNRLILVGDSAQLPPVGEEISNALNVDFLKKYGEINYVVLKSVVRQAGDSGILHNATLIRNIIESQSEAKFPKLELKKFTDIERITGGDLIEKLQTSYDKSSSDETLVLCRSNKKANRYNQGIRSKIMYRDERITRGDKLMIVKNCYQFLENIDEIDFIANGDVAELVKISGYEERYGLNFARATLRFPDYNNVEIEARVILDTLESESASLNSEQQRALFNSVMEDYSHIKLKRKRIAAVREDIYYNALQIKHANAITCHKSQGGQWKNVFIDNPFWKDEISKDDLKWLYTAITRATDKVYFVNFDDRFFVK
ncbi:MAG: ATP-dependent endonuclease [Bacteroidetes bacterium HGW-Bacteroidetes-8]|jgi:exodeoxyribonuclease-5|nr:MAG: ATP-dependent endonuclease [Bacteroidetes bacterium HGW-Bacteroidetes-8]